MSKESNKEQIEKALLLGGVVVVKSCKVFIHNPENFDIFEPLTGFWVKNAMGWITYFKCPTRDKAQVACNELFGVGKYTVNSKI